MPMKKIIPQFITGIIFSFLFGILGLLPGSFIGGNFGFPLLWDMQGYESGGVFFALIGVALGALAGFLAIAKKFNETHRIIFLLSISILALLIDFFLWNGSNMTIWRLMLVLMLPSLLLSFAFHFQFLTSKNNL